MTFMRMHSRSLFAVSLILLFGSIATAGLPLGTPLYGIKPGTEIKDIQSQYGEPGRRYEYPDGWKSYGYFFSGYVVIVETEPDDPEYVIAVQLSGNHNPAGMGFKDINLGDPVDKLIETLGAPDTIDTATDEETGEYVPDTVFISYTNASFEVVDGKVTSIKTHFPNRKELARKKA